MATDIHAKDVGGCHACTVAIVDGTNPTGFAALAGWHLRFDHARTYVASGICGLVGRAHRSTGGNGNACASKQRLGHIFFKQHQITFRIFASVSRKGLFPKGGPLPLCGPGG